LARGQAGTGSATTGDFGENIIFTDIGREAWLTQQDLTFPAHVANGFYHNDFYQTFQQMNFDLVLYQMLFVYCQLEHMKCNERQHCTAMPQSEPAHHPIGVMETIDKCHAELPLSIRCKEKILHFT